jgi:secreted trypsin-like serine protease
MAVSLGASAQAGPRIINGSPASPGEYPAQGFLELSTSAGNFVCGGTLVSNRYFVTAAHCATELNSTTPLDASDMTVTLGKVDKGDFEPSDRFAVAENRVNADYDLIGPTNNVPDGDIALLRLATPAPPGLEPLRLVEAGETGLWATGDTATVIGWGVTEANALSDRLLEATVPMRSDADCSAVWGSRFHNTTMVCAGGGFTDTCGGDSGGPLMVSDGAFLILAGITSWGADPCADPNRPGVYTRLGDPALNGWVRAQVPMARATVEDATPDTGQAVEFSVTTTDPGIPAFTNFAWDFESDGVTDALGANPTHTYPTAGPFIARVRATGAPGDLDTAVAKVRVDVAQAPPAPTPTPTPAPIVTPPPPTTEPVPRRLATILTLKTPQIRRSRFKMRINFARNAPAGNAFVEVFRRKKKIGSVRARVRRGGSRQVSVKLTKAGMKLLRRSERKRMRVKVQVRVKRQILGSKTLTIRL